MEMVEARTEDRTKRMKRSTATESDFSRTTPEVDIAGVLPQAASSCDWLSKWGARDGVRSETVTWFAALEYSIYMSPTRGRTRFQVSQRVRAP